MIMLAASLLAGAAASSAPICADRPGKANAVCTVPSGKLQLELSAIDWTQSDSRSRNVSLAAPTFKLGISRRSDIQLSLNPYVRSVVSAGDGRHRTAGFGDLTVRYKLRLTRDERPVQVALIPSVKLPTASRNFGNGTLEAGLAVPISFALAGPVTMTLGPEIDLLANGSDHRRHVAIVNVAGLSVPVSPATSISGEIWSSLDLDPARTARQLSLDAAVAQLLSPTLQLDAGANLGLTRDTPRLELYSGVSLRF